MEKKSDFKTAILFVSLVAVLLAILFTFLFIVGRYVYKYKVNSVEDKPVPAQQVQTSVPYPKPQASQQNPVEEEDAPSNICVHSRLQFFKPDAGTKVVSSFQKGLEEMLANGDNKGTWVVILPDGTVKRYFVDRQQSSAERYIYKANGNLVSQLLLAGDVILFTDSNMETFYPEGLLRQITVYQKDCKSKDRKDRFYIDEQGRYTTCTCADGSKTCCLRPPYSKLDRLGYCDMHPEDDDICGQNPAQLPDFAKWIKQATPDKQPLAHIRGEKITVRSHQGPETPLEYQMLEYRNLLKYTKENRKDGIFPIFPGVFGVICPEEAPVSQMQKPALVVKADSIEQGQKQCREIERAGMSTCSMDDFAEGVEKCRESSYYPCAWEKKSQDVSKQYWVTYELVSRKVYDRDGNLIGGTMFNVADGQVQIHMDNNIVTYYSTPDTVLTHLTRYNSCKQKDEFWFDKQGNLTRCSCDHAWSDADCCARVPDYVDVGKPLHYCDLYPQDEDFCKK